MGHARSATALSVFVALGTAIFCEAQQATDSTGTDLTGDDKTSPNYRGRLDFHPDRRGESKAFTLRHDAPRRQAKTFDGQGNVNIKTYSGPTQVEFDVSPGWTNLDDEMFGCESVRCKLDPNAEFKEKLTPVLTFEPGAVRAAIDDIALRIDDESIVSRSSMWSEQRSTYDFDIEKTGDYVVEVTLRTNLRNRSVRLDVTDQKLP